MKFFTNKKCTKKNLIKLICQFAKERGVKRVVFNSTGKRISGSYNPKTKIIYLNLKTTKHEFLCAFFHELGHHKAVQKKLWNKYHFNLVESMDAEKVFEIENNIDKIGKQLWNQHVYLKTWGKYKYFYPKKDQKYFFNNLK
jgi:hypothetical protein